MVQENGIEAVRNRKTQKLFILMDDSLGTRFKVINPAGEVLILPDLLFDEDSIFVPMEQQDEAFTAEQLASLIKENQKIVERPPEPPPRREPSARPVPTRKIKPRETQQSRRGLAATWTSPKLTFYRHKIEPLQPKQSFRIQVEGLGSFEITKEEFLAQFNDVVMSATYRSDGLYSYPQLPDKAKRYLKD